MTRWEARLERIIRCDVGRSARPWSGISRNASSDPEGQPIVRNAHAIPANGYSTPKRDVAQRASGGARSRAVHRPCELVVEAQHDGDAVIVLLAGEFDLAAAEPVRRALTRAISEPGQRLIVDLTGLTFIDSSGLHAILNAYKLCRETGPTLTIRPGPPEVQRVFELTNLLDYLPFEVSS